MIFWEQLCVVNRTLYMSLGQVVSFATFILCLEGVDLLPAHQRYSPSETTSCKWAYNTPSDQAFHCLQLQGLVGQFAVMFWVWREDGRCMGTIDKQLGIFQRNEGYFRCWNLWNFKGFDGQHFSAGGEEGRYVFSLCVDYFNPLGTLWTPKQVNFNCHFLNLSD